MSIGVFCCIPPRNAHDTMSTRSLGLYAFCIYLSTVQRMSRTLSALSCLLVVLEPKPRLATAVNETESVSFEKGHNSQLGLTLAAAG